MLTSAVAGAAGAVGAAAELPTRPPQRCNTDDCVPLA